MFKNQGNNIASLLVLSLIFLLGIGLGWLSFLLFGDMAANSRVLYVSQKEILQLEKERIAGTEEESLFFGKISQALGEMQVLAKNYQNRRSKVIFVADEFVTGDNVHSISKQVHRQVIDKLKTSIKDITN